MKVVIARAGGGPGPGVVDPDGRNDNELDLGPHRCAVLAAPVPPNSRLDAINAAANRPDPVAIVENCKKSLKSLKSLVEPFIGESDKVKVLEVRVNRTEGVLASPTTRRLLTLRPLWVPCICGGLPPIYVANWTFEIISLLTFIPGPSLVPLCCMLQDDHPRARCRQSSASASTGQTTPSIASSSASDVPVDAVGVTLAIGAREHV